MKKLKFRHISAILILLLTAVGSGYAQTSYYCDFEDPAEAAQWQLNSLKAGASLTTLDQWWFIGEAGQCGYGGENGLFVSIDSVNPVYKGAKTCWTTAYRDINLNPGVYTLRFDWKFLGKGTDMVVACFVPNTNKCLSGSGTDIPSASKTYQIGNSLRGKQAWSSFSSTFTVTSANQAGRLVFYFFATEGGAANPAASIDNITITNQACAAPSNLTYDNVTGRLSWSGVGSNYEVRYYNFQSGEWHDVTNISTKSYTVNLTEEGYTFFYVRAVCDSANHVCSDWVSTGTFVYIRNRRCVEYLDLGTNKATNAGICYVGEHEGSSYVHSSLKFDPNPTKVDNGYLSPASMHTIHYDPSETDPNSGGWLTTVPEGEIASVRLGAYTSTGEDARVEYKYTVTAGQSDLMDLSYACVLQSGGHGSDNPFFQLDVLDSKGNQIGGCTHEYFVADMTGSQGGKWHQNGDIWWSNWDRVTVSLRNYVGQTLTIRLTASRCVYDTHFGYAYFTIGCRSGSLEGLSCGDYSTDHFTAPDGFDYRWRKVGDPTGRVLSTDRTFGISPTDTSTYTVDCVSKTSSQCYYVLTANPNPRFPVAQVDTTSVLSRNCSNVVTFRNRSHISIINRETHEETATTDPVEDVVWEFGDGETISSLDETVTHVYPETGGTFEFRAYASMSNGVCVDSTAVIRFTLPDLVHTGDTTEVHRQVHHPYRGISGKVYDADRDTMYVDSILRPNQYGCQAPYYEFIYFHRAFSDTTHVIICEGDSVQFEVGDTIVGYHLKTFYTSAKDSAIYKTVNDADSIQYLDLYVVPRVRVEVDPLIVLCGDEPVLPVTVTPVVGGRQIDSIRLYPDHNAVAEGMERVYCFGAHEPIELPLAGLSEASPYLKPNYYHFGIHIEVTYDTVGAPLCPTDEYAFDVELRYASSILDQKSNYIALLNDRYNYGGFTYSHVRWFKDGVELIGENATYIHVTDLDIGSEYHVIPTRTDDGVSIPSCVLRYEGYNVNRPITPYRVAPRAVHRGGMVEVSGASHVSICDMSGRVVSSYETSPSETSPIRVPGTVGLYLVIFDGNSAERVLVYE